MRTHSQIVAATDAWQLAEMCGASVHTVRSWKHRDSIPAEHWAVLTENGLASLEELAAGVKPRGAKVAA